MLFGISLLVVRFLIYADVIRSALVKIAIFVAVDGIYLDAYSGEVLLRFSDIFDARHIARFAR